MYVCPCLLVCVYKCILTCMPMCMHQYQQKHPLLLYKTVTATSSTYQDPQLYIYKCLYQISIHHLLHIAQSKWEQKMSQIRKKSLQAGNCFILFFKWSLITINFWAPKNHGGMCRNFEKRVDKISFFQISSLKLIL